MNKTPPKQTPEQRRAAISEGVKLAWARRRQEAPLLLPQKETAIVKLILDVLSLKYKGKLKLWRNNTGALPREGGGFIKFGAVGSPDLLGILAPSGRLVGLEVKAPKGKTSEHQETWLKEAQEFGALVGVVHSVDEACALIDGALDG